ncbi:hypothetical protein [Cerasicoccus frondis]|uniref:hypothetical protein n=1 Tax=Cerasicoccus frondis TaxID=490090 RepID=UPI00285265E7|nr:hypothetical protein [Cerasicoccus frondis]
MQLFRHCFLIASAATLLTACKTNQSEQAPPPPAQLVGGPCEYNDTPGIAVVSDSDAEQVRFLIDGRITPYSRQDLPDYDYQTGAKFKVIEKRITKGACTPYILEILGPA